MSEILLAEAERSSDLIGLFVETPWPTMLLSASGVILALNKPVRDLLGFDETIAIGKPIESLVPNQERARVRSLLKQVASNELPNPSRAHLCGAGKLVLTVDLEAVTVPDDPAGHVMLIVHPFSLTHRREQLLLELNRLAPALLAAQTPDEIFNRAARALGPLGLGMSIALFDPD